MSPLPGRRCPARRLRRSCPGAATAWKARRRPLRRGHARAAAGLRAVLRQQADWLDDYALFMALGEVHGADRGVHLVRLAGAAGSARPGGAGRRRARAGPAAGLLALRAMVLRPPVAALRAYANQRGVQIVGDAPDLRGHHSADVWAHPELFDLDERGRPRVVAGVPPDFFSAVGQRWGNPLYRWDEHAKDDYAWWVRRIRHEFERVDLLRIDHFRGFAATGRYRPTSPRRSRAAGCRGRASACSRPSPRRWGRCPSSPRTWA
jgi:4-alpha-glucanotransferase